MNTLEQLIVFLPSIWFFGTYVNAAAAAGLGVVFIIGRGLYLASYVKDPETRTTGALMTMGSNVILLFGALIGAGLALV